MSKPIRDSLYTAAQATTGVVAVDGVNTLDLANHIDLIVKVIILLSAASKPLIEVYGLLKQTNAKRKLKRSYNELQD